MKCTEGVTTVCFSSAIKFLFPLIFQLSAPPEKRLKVVPPPTERIMIYVRQETEEAFTALHLVSE